MMKIGNQMKIWVALFTVSSGMAFSSIGWACSEMETFEFAVERGTADGIPLILLGNIEGPEVAHDPSGEIVEGSLEPIAGTHIFVFRPTEALVVGSYTVTILHHGFAYTETTEVVEKDAPNLAIETVAAIQEERGSMVCCPKVTGECFEWCGSSDCTSCWPSGYDYKRQLRINLETAQPVIISAGIVGTQAQHTTILRQGQTFLDLRDAKLDAAQTCATIVVSDLAENEIERHEVCVSEDEFPEVVRRESDAKQQVSLCVGPPSDPEDPNWKLYGDHRLQEGGNGGGCSSANSVASLFLLLFVFGFRRRLPSFVTSSSTTNTYS